MPYQAYDLDDLTRLMEDRWDGTPFWSDVEAQNAINEALYMWNALTGYWKDRRDIPVILGQSLYELPSNIVFGFRVEYQQIPLEPTSQYELDSSKPGWEVEEGTPRKWIPLDLNTIILYPTPIIDATMTVDGIAITPILVYDTDFVQLGSDSLDAIVGYALHAVALKEGGERFATTIKYFDNFLSAAAILNTQLLKSEQFRQFLGLDLKREERPTK